MGLDTVEMVMEIEQEFGIDIPDADAERIFTVGTLADYVWRRRQEVVKGIAPAPLPPTPIHAPSADSYQAVLERVRRIVADHFGARLDDVQAHTRFVEDLHAD